MDDRSELREDIKADKEVADEIKVKKDKETLTVSVCGENGQQARLYKGVAKL